MKRMSNKFQEIRSFSRIRSDATSQAQPGAVVPSNTEHIFDDVGAFGSTGRQKYRRRTFRPLAFRTLMIYS